MTVDEPYWRDMFGIEYTREELEAASTVWVCTRHKRFLPCRPCLYSEVPEAAGRWDSCDPQDVEIVRKYQSGPVGG
jgi:hypothetical protein